MADCRLVSIATIVALWTPVTLLVKVIIVLLKWKYKTKLHEFGRYVTKAKLLLSKLFRPGHGHMVKF